MNVTRLLVAALVALLSFAAPLGAAAQTAADEPDAARSSSVLNPSAWRTIALDRALASARTIEDPYRRAQSLASIARAQTLLPDSPVDRTLHDALSAAREVSSAEFRAWALQDIVLAQIAAEDLLGARETTASIEARRPQGAALAAIADFQLRSGDSAAALASARKIRDKDPQGGILRRIVAIQASTGELDKARRILKEIDEPFHRALATGDIAVAELRNGNVKEALELGSTARRAYRSQVYGRIVLAQADAGDLQAAIEALRHIDDPLHRALIQGGIAAVRASNGDAEAAGKLFAEAFSMIDAFPEKTQRAVLTRAQLARMRNVTGDRAGASAQLMRAAEEIQHLPPGPAREEALDYVGRSQARIGEADAALASARQMNDRIARALLVRDVVTLQSDPTSASAAAIAARFNEPLIETAALFGVLGAQLVERESAKSSTTIEAARKSVRRLNDAQLKPAAFAALAAASVRVGDAEAGHEIFEEALAAAATLAPGEQQAIAYTSVITALNERLMFLGQPADGDLARVLRPLPFFAGEGQAEGVH